MRRTFERLLNIGLSLTILGVLAAASIPILYVAAGIDVFALVGQTPGLGHNKLAAYLWMCGLASAALIIVLSLLRRPFVWWAGSASVIALCVVFALAAYRVTQVELYDSFFDVSNRRLFTPVIPSLERLYSDTTWKTEISSFASFFDAAERRREWIAPELEAEGLSPTEAQVVAYMLFVSSMWAYGNQDATDRPGCVLGNEDNEWVLPDPITAEAYSTARIGCCDDYAHILKSILDRARFENRLVSSPGHIFNEVLVSTKWHTVDANTNLFIDRAWSEIEPSEPLRIFRFPHPSGEPGSKYRPVIPLFQKMRLNLAMRGEPGRVTYPDLPTHFTD